LDRRDLSKDRFPRENHDLHNSREPQGSKDKFDGFPLKTPPALPQLDPDDYPNARFWTAQEWQKFVNDQMDYGSTHGKLGFICDEDGDPVAKERIKKMTETAKNCGDLYRHRYDPDTWRCVRLNILQLTCVLHMKNYASVPIIGRFRHLRRFGIQTGRVVSEAPED
jgi:hypothetical protein